MEQKKTIREVTVESRLLYQRLQKMEVGELITYSELSNIIGRDVQDNGRGSLNTARRMCEREDQKTFGVITNEGLKCLNGSEVISTAEYTAGHIKRTSRRALKRLNCVGDMNQLSNDEIIKMNTYASLMGAFVVMGKESNVKKLSSAVEKTQDQLPYTKTLEAFK